MSATNERPLILVIDDDQTICEVVDLVLADEGYDVMSAGNISTALLLIQERQPDVILLDLTLPGPGGEGFVAAYRRLPGPSAPILVMSGRADVRQRVATIGADGVIAKPFEIDDLVMAVRVMLARTSVLADVHDRDAAPVDDDSADMVCSGP